MMKKASKEVTTMSSKSLERQRKLEEWRKQKEVEKQTQMRSTFPGKQIRVPLSTVTPNIKNDTKQNVVIEVTPSIKLTKSQIGKMNLDATTPLASKKIEPISIKKDTVGKRKVTSSSTDVTKKSSTSTSQKEVRTEPKHVSECTTGTQTETRMDPEIEQEKEKEIINCLQETIENQLLEIQTLRTKLDSNQEKPVEMKKVEEGSTFAIAKVDSFRDKLLAKDQEIKALKFLLKQSIYLRQQKEKECESQLQRIEELESRLTQLIYEYEIPMNETGEKQELLSLLPDRENRIQLLEKALHKQKEAVSCLRFSNEMLVQRMAEMRGKFISQIQEAYRLKKNAEQEQKSDADAWNQLMNNMVRQMEEQMTQGLRVSVEKIEYLTKELEAERTISGQLQEQLQRNQIHQNEQENALLKTQKLQL